MHVFVEPQLKSIHTLNDIRPARRHKGQASAGFSEKRRTITARSLRGSCRRNCIRVTRVYADQLVTECPSPVTHRVGCRLPARVDRRFATRAGWCVAVVCDGLPCLHVRSGRRSRPQHSLVWIAARMPRSACAVSATSVCGPCAVVALGRRVRRPEVVWVAVARTASPSRTPKLGPPPAHPSIQRLANRGDHR